MNLGDLARAAARERFGHLRSAEHASTAMARFVLRHGPDARASRALSAPSLRRYLASMLADGLAPATVARHAAVLSGMLAEARARGVKVPDRVPVPRMPRPRARARVLSTSEVDAMVALLPLDLARLVRFLAETGCRVGEALALGWGDVLDGRATFRETKNGSARTVPLSAAAMVSLGGPTAPRPFPSTASQLNHAWRRAMVALDIEDRDFVPHALRHTFGTRLAASGTSLPVVMRFLGHRDVASAMRYQHAGVEDLELALGRLVR